MCRRFLLLTVLAAVGCRTTDRTFLAREDRARQREAEFDTLGVARVLADRDVDQALMEQQYNRR